MEIKWTEGVSKQKDLSIFDGKIKGKAQSPRGVFISMNGFDENVINKYSTDSPRIVLMTGEDLMYVLNGSRSLHDVLAAKINALVTEGKIYYSVRNM